MIFRALGSTEINTSIVGLGTVKIGRNQGVKYPTAFSIPDDNAVIQLLNTSVELGINLLDTAPAYGNSEQRLGELLPKAAQHDWLISTKAGEVFDSASGQSTYDFSDAAIRKSVEQSCRRLKRDVIDIVMIHSDGNDQEIIKRGALEALSELKRAGLIRAIGMSTKTLSGGILALEQSDVLMVTHNLEYQGELSVIEQAAKMNKSIFIKKALASGHITHSTYGDPVTESFAAILPLPAVSSVILGSINAKHICENVEKAVRVASSLNA